MEDPKQHFEQRVCEFERELHLQKKPIKQNIVQENNFGRGYLLDDW